MRVLIVHPEGNITSNPNLAGIAELLSKNSFIIDVLSQKYPNKYQKNTQHWQMILMPNLGTLLKYCEKKKKIISSFLLQLLKKAARGYSLIIGVDREGIILANAIARMANVPYIFISYEIFFEQEIGAEKKLSEIEACKKIIFAICQDEDRAKLLATENRIPLEKIICIPVAGFSSESPVNTDYLHSRFHIEPTKKIALFIGSLSPWACVDEILQSTTSWPKDWVLVLHSRYVNSDISCKISKLTSGNIYVSDSPCESLEELYRLVSSSDLGVAFYKPTYTSIYTGKNLECIGWSSGKITTYMWCGVPVLVNEIGTAAAIIENNDLGYVLHEKQQIGDLLSHITSHDLKRKGENCSAFFSDFLALNNYEAKILEKIATINLIKSNSNLFNFNQLNCFITVICYILKPLFYVKRLISRLWKIKESGVSP